MFFSLFNDLQYWSAAVTVSFKKILHATTARFVCMLATTCGASALA